MKYRKFRYVLFALCLISSLAALSLAKLENAGSKTTSSRQHGRSSMRPPPRGRRANIDLLYSNEEDEDTIEIDPAEQERRLKEAKFNCTLRIKASANSSQSKRTKEFCPIFWDEIICWPNVPLNKLHSVPCPNYVNKFNRKNKATKRCVYNQTLQRAAWIKTNFSMCLEPSPHIIKDMTEITIIEHHLKYIMAIRLCGYIMSMVSLILSIIILTRPKMRCPRNFIHVNLFVTFCLHTVSIMVVDILRQKTEIFKISPNSSHNIVDNDPRYSVCRSVVTVFRYSGSVYHAAITTEAIYLMLLLRFPYYSEKKGSKFSIITSWVLPLGWLIPWIIVRIFVESQWCWQVESLWNLLIEIPHTFLTIINVIAAVYIICTLYSKMQTHELNPEKVIKYRRLAKSILILVPIFGLHFIFFEWMPYLRAINSEEFEFKFELPLMYLEALFNSFQGVMASIACCFIHLEARIEILVMIRRILKRLKLLNTFERIKCLTPEYITKLRHSRENSRHSGSASGYRHRSLSCAPAAAAAAAAAAASGVVRSLSLRPHSRSYSQAFIQDDVAVNAAVTVDAISPHTTTASVTTGLLNASSLTNLNNQNLLDRSFKSSTSHHQHQADHPNHEHAHNAHHHHHHHLHFRSMSSSRRRKLSIDSNVSFRNVCCCLFTNQKNDFYSSNTSRRKSAGLNSITSSHDSHRAPGSRLLSCSSNHSQSNGGHLKGDHYHHNHQESFVEFANSTIDSPRTSNGGGGKFFRFNTGGGGGGGGGKRQWSLNRRRIQMINRANNNSLKIAELNKTDLNEVAKNGEIRKASDETNSGSSHLVNSGAGNGLEVRFLSNSLGEIITRDYEVAQRKRPISDLVNGGRGGGGEDGGIHKVTTTRRENEKKPVETDKLMGEEKEKLNKHDIISE